MGQTLSEPIVEKHSSEDGDDRLIYAASCMQGWRTSMEDAHTTILRLEGSNVAFFAVYDGHGGQRAAVFSGSYLHSRIAAEDSFKKEQYPEAIKKGFLATDSDLKLDAEFATDPSGCTAVTAIIEPGKRVFVGNAGDSRAIMSVKGKSVALSHDHKPANKTEATRILAAGGFVEFGRVNGNLALSRAIGDFEYKRGDELSPEQQVITSNPDIIEHALGEDEEFIVLACDGIWDCMTSQEVIDFVRTSISKKKPLTLICEELMTRCLAPDSEIAGIGCDNMTVVIVGLLNGLTKTQWYEAIYQRVRQSDATDSLGNFLEDESESESESKLEYFYIGNVNENTSNLASTADDGNRENHDDSINVGSRDQPVGTVGSIEAVESRNDDTASAPDVLTHTSNSITTTIG